MKLRDIREGQDYLMRAVRHLAQRAAVVKEGRIAWLMGPEAAADGIMTRAWEQLEAMATRSGEPGRSKSTRQRKKADRRKQAINEVQAGDPS